MKTINCIVLEDEEPAQNLIRHYLNQIPEITLLEVFENALEASDFLKENTVDLIFTDIDMPRLSGLDFIQILSQRPPIVIITAYPNRAYEAYNLDVVDYIVKPVSFDRFKKSIEKVQRFLLNVSDEIPSSDISTIYVREAGKMLKLTLSDIIYVEGLADYVKIITQERSITVLSTMSNLEKILPKSQFARVHRSFIISTNKITAIDSANSLVILNNKIEITLGRTYKTDFLSRFKAIN